MDTTQKCLAGDKNADVFVTALPSGKHQVRVQPRTDSLFVPFDACETAYPVSLIQMILTAKGSAYLIDEILRDESSGYVQHDLKWSVLSYLSKEEFANKRILDFGCGSGSSSVTLARMFPSAEVLGIELEERLLNVSRARANFYGFKNLRFQVSSAPDELPVDIGTFDFVVLSAVYEHLLPAEREVLLPQLWSTLKPGGVLFLNGTPNRYFPLEMHTTGLPIINYLPDKLVHSISRRYSRRNLEKDSWEELLRAGIRGGTIGEIVSYLPLDSGVPLLLEPKYFGIRDRIDLWFALSSENIGRARSPLALFAKRIYRWIMKPVKAFSGVEFLPELALAIEKNGAIVGRN
jgi:2-polyprenyl-3-methyl-5-hydroxy-6-metoxy-1,4-benzoquinol methylase